MIGKFGEIIFETNDKRIRNFLDLKRESSIRTVSHEIINAKPILEYQGPDLDTLNFSVILNGNLGLKPKDELKTWRKKYENVEAEDFLLASEKIGDNKWLITNISESYEKILNTGEILIAKLDITLQEYREAIDINYIKTEEKSDIEINVPVQDNLINRYGIITAKIGLNLREGPDINSKRIGGLDRNEKTFIVSETNGWYKNDKNQYMYAIYVRLL